MTTGANNFALDILNGVPYQKISDAGSKAAIATLCAQLSTYRSQGTAVAAVGVLRLACCAVASQLRPWQHWP
jgi:hypothetical protein